MGMPSDKSPIASIAPQDAVFSIPELVESILLHLDMKELLTTAQLVCHIWTNVIKGSSTIQQKLFFLPKYDIKKTVNPILADVFPSFFPTGREKASQLRGLTLSTFGMIKNGNKTEAYAHKRASWRRMLIQQPPITEFAFIQHTSARDYMSHTEYKILVGRNSCPQPDVAQRMS